jgi:hypothetical protein
VGAFDAPLAWRKLSIRAMKYPPMMMVPISPNLAGIANGVSRENESRV